MVSGVATFVNTILLKSILSAHTTFADFYLQLVRVGLEG